MICQLLLQLSTNEIWCIHNTNSNLLDHQEIAFIIIRNPPVRRSWQSFSLRFSYRWGTKGNSGQEIGWADSIDCKKAKVICGDGIRYLPLFLPPPLHPHHYPLVSWYPLPGWFSQSKQKCSERIVLMVQPDAFSNQFLGMFFDLVLLQCIWSFGFQVFKRK